jgi:hypothetical protein
VGETSCRAAYDVEAQDVQSTESCQQRYMLKAGTSLTGA